jgi:hypothetical protein
MACLKSLIGQKIASGIANCIPANYQILIDRAVIGQALIAQPSICSLPKADMLRNLSTASIMHSPT